MSEILTFTFEDTDWHSLNLYPGSVTVKNLSGSAISIYIKDTDVVPSDLELANAGIDPLEIGGLIQEVTNEHNKFIFGKSKTGTGSVSVRESGTVDPAEDITYLANVLSQVGVELNTHKIDNTNPHTVTKDQVGLGNIPNLISDDPTLADSGVIASTKATSEILDVIGFHQTNMENPHLVTKDQIGLGNVENFLVATDIEAVNSSLDNLYMTPKTTYAAMRAWVQVSLSMKSQIVVEGQVASRLVGWSNNDCDYPSRIIEKLTDNQIVVRDNLRVAFADNGKTRDSVKLASDQTINLPASPVDGIYYIFANINSDTTFASFGMTRNKYKEGMSRGGHIGDFFSVPENVMYDMNNSVIRRVYLGKCYVQSGIIVNVIPVPVGDSHVIPVTSALTLGGRDLYSNPFVSAVDVKAEVEYNFTWGESGWNDQIGVVAHPFPTNPTDHLIIQAGMMGFIACGREAGSPFGASFAAITAAPRARMIVKKKY